MAGESLILLFQGNQFLNILIAVVVNGHLAHHLPVKGHQSRDHTHGNHNSVPRIAAHHLSTDAQHGPWPEDKLIDVVFTIDQAVYLPLDFLSDARALAAEVGGSLENEPHCAHEKKHTYYISAHVTRAAVAHRVKMPAGNESTHSAKDKVLHRLLDGLLLDGLEQLA